MKKKLKIGLKVIQNSLVFWVLEQEGLPEQKSDDGFVKIYNAPELFNGKVYLRGYVRNKDDDVSVMQFKSKKEAIEFKEKIIKSITEELFKKEEKIKPGDLVNVSMDGDDWVKREYITSIDENITPYRHICMRDDRAIAGWKYITNITSTISFLEEDDEIYTWVS